MKNCIKNRFLLPALLAAISLLPARPAAAQTFTTLHDFALDGFDTASSSITNSDGAGLSASLVISGNTLYGAAAVGGTNGSGTVFAVNTDGTGFTNLYVFTAHTGPYPPTNLDGYYPAGSLVLSGNMLYGTASEGGTNGTGTVFALNTNGTGFSILHTFTAQDQITYTNRDGAFPGAGLILSGTTLFGTAENGGFSGNGTVFALNLDGSGFTNLHNFSGYAQGQYTNRDGSAPAGSLILSGNTLYGTASAGGSTGNGTVFAVNTNGTGFTNLYSFTANPAPDYTNTDGAIPEAGLILSGSTLYGTADEGGNSDDGTVFALNTDDTCFTNLHNFYGSFYTAYNSDGVEPQASLVLAGNTLYGTASYGGSEINGTLFALNTNGTGFMPLHTFTARVGSNGTNSDGALPKAGLILAGNNLYGVASLGGNGGAGTVFSLALAGPQLAIMLSGTNVILTWPEPGFTLQSAANLAAPVWTPVAGQNVVTNPISGTKMFYRLSQ